jgi:hypothetical protein
MALFPVWTVPSSKGSEKKGKEKRGYKEAAAWERWISQYLDGIAQGRGRGRASARRHHSSLKKDSGSESELRVSRE